MPDLTVPEWLKANSPYHVVILLALLAPNLTHLGVSSSVPSTFSDLWSPTFLSLGVTLLSFIASRNNLAGPFRYGLHKYGPWMHTLYEKAPDGTVWALVGLRFLLPGSQAWLIGVISVGWQYIQQHFREDVRNLTDQANNMCARASIAASTVQAHVAEAARYELDALGNGAQVLRDARQAQGIKASDFFSASQTAWTAIESAANATNSAHHHGLLAVPEAERARNTASSSHYSTANTSYNSMYAASNELNSANNKAEVARDTLTRFTEARTKDRDARDQEQSHADQAVIGARKIIKQSARLSAASARLAMSAQEVRHTASVAVAAVEQGRMTQAKEGIQKAKETLKKVEKEARRIASVKSEVRRLYVTQILGEDYDDEEEEEEEEDSDSTSGTMEF